MNYITDERKMIQQMARDFALEQVLPIANKLDPEQGEIPMSLRDKMAELGYFGILIPEEYGGLGLGAFEYALVTEELARAWMSVASIIARGNSLWGGVTEEDKRRYFPKIARGEWLGAFSLSEPDAGSDLANVACKATRAGDEWIINGTKTWCTFADGADYIVLFARTSPPTDPKRRHVGISQFLVQKERGTFPPGITGSPIRKIGYFGWKTFELHFDNFPSAGLGAARRGRPRLLRDDGGAGDGAGAYRRTRDRPCARRARRFRRVRQATLAVRPSHRRLPGDPLQAGRDGREYRGRAPVDVLRRQRGR